MRRTLDLPPAINEKRPAKKPVKQTNAARAAQLQANTGAVNSPDYAVLQKRLADLQKQTQHLKAQRQSIQQQLDEKSKQLAALIDARSSVKVSDNAQIAQLTDLQNQNTALKKQITTLTAEKISNSLELATAKTRDRQDAVVQLKKQLMDSQNNAVTLLDRLNKLTAKQAANEKALAEMNNGDSKAVADLKRALTSSQSESTALKKSLSESQSALADLKKQVATLTASQSDGVKTLAQAKQQLAESQNQAAALTKQLVTLNQSHIESTKLAASQLKASLQENQNIANNLLAKNANLIAEDKRKSEQVEAAKQSLADSQKQLADSQKQLADSQKQLADSKKQLAELRNKKPVAAGTREPKSQNEVRSYALGTLWGQEVSGAIVKVKSDGIAMDLAQVVSGISDSLNGKFKIPQQKIIDELSFMNKQALARGKPAQSQSTKDNYIQAFSKKPGTKRAEMGYYYRILNKGHGKITSGDVVAILVKESLSSGKVIKDMTKTGKVLALPLANFPPLFATAISQMNNKGKLIMAVPPELAYGEQGRLPEIPPNSTMVYEITVADVRPAEGK
ncbi:FKBP-type peptidyl-prolyl cis-trans isomerase [Enterobacter ludwigii]|uniref:FKBP-type peptidyl-prolyl cis-trans isomerase n=1 Tax=Enterobacter ludwigii TaxID=299767 RepID=UPI00159C6FEA|nr:FKBP-type peptidyl-prolyl cis-trans isomerase [Enterobacter ludwigii]QLA06947.1 FKBP-type peptidyl-prolyl cis-trans isomerase [Enterobacter ludwigii]